MKQFLSVHDAGNPEALIRQALRYKANPLMDRQLGAGKRIGLIFLNPSLRTRLSTQIAAENLGMEPIVFNVGSEGWSWEFEEGTVMNGSSVEHVKDAAPILGQYFDILALRTFPGLRNREADYSEFYMQQFIKYAGVPVVSLESATLHPLQSLTDLLTITEHFTENRKPRIVLTWAPHIKALPQCVANSFAQWVNAWDRAEFIITHPEGYELDEQYTNGATFTKDREEALRSADFVYVKNWSSYQQYGEVLCTDTSWMLTPDQLGTHTKLMHCLPVRRNVEVTDAVLDSPHSLITAQASNRVWAAQAVLSSMLRGNESNH
jgi:N-succinyl-L-ornithine transcarbamylase